jgi:hypothetical protein
MHCDCGANPDELCDPACMTRQGEPEDPSQHYDQ